jgi:hypothetical protein
VFIPKCTRNRSHFLRSFLHLIGVFEFCSFTPNLCGESFGIGAKNDKNFGTN